MKSACSVFVQNTSRLNDSNGFRYLNCGGQTDLIAFKTITLKPDPLKLPGDFNVEVQFTVKADIRAPIGVGTAVNYACQICFHLSYFLHRHHLRFGERLLDGGFQSLATCSRLAAMWVTCV